MSQEILEKLKQSILNYDAVSAVRAADEAVKAKMDFRRALEALTETLRKLGEKFSQGEIYLPHLVMAAEAAEKATHVLQVLAPKDEKVSRGRIVIGTVQGDIHDIGKSIVSAILRSSGFEVYDLGKDVSADRLIQKAEEVVADVIATSALMTVTIPKQKELEEELRRLNIKDKYKTIVGGGAVTPEWAEEIGADGFAWSALDSVKVLEKMLPKGG